MYTFNVCVVFDIKKHFCMLAPLRFQNKAIWECGLARLINLLSTWYINISCIYTHALISKVFSSLIWSGVIFKIYWLDINYKFSLIAYSICPVTQQPSMEALNQPAAFIERGNMRIPHWGTKRTRYYQNIRCENISYLSPESHSFSWKTMMLNDHIYCFVNHILREMIPRMKFIEDITAKRNASILCKDGISHNFAIYTSFKQGFSHYCVHWTLAAGWYSHTILWGHPYATTYILYIRASIYKQHIDLNFLPCRTNGYRYTAFKSPKSEILNLIVRFSHILLRLVHPYTYLTHQMHYGELPL